MRIYILAIIVLLITLFAHISGMNGLYMSIPAYDIFMHILGGVGIGLFVTAFVQSNISGLSRKKRIVMACALAAGIIWEGIEAYYNIAGAPLWTKAYYLDTVKDLIDDTLGGMIVAFLYFKNK